MWTRSWGSILMDLRQYRDGLRNDPENFLKRAGQNVARNPAAVVRTNLCQEKFLSSNSLLYHQFIIWKKLLNLVVHTGSIGIAGGPVICCGQKFSLPFECTPQSYININKGEYSIVYNSQVA